MIKKEYIEKNIGITFDFVKHIIDHPKLFDTIIDGAEIDFIDKECNLKNKQQIQKKRVIRYKVQHTFEPVKA